MLLGYTRSISRHSRGRVWARRGVISGCLQKITSREVMRVAANSSIPTEGCSTWETLHLIANMRFLRRTDCQGYRGDMDKHSCRGMGSRFAYAAVLIGMLPFAQERQIS